MVRAKEEMDVRDLQVPKVHEVFPGMSAVLSTRCLQKDVQAVQEGEVPCTGNWKWKLCKMGKIILNKY